MRVVSLNVRMMQLCEGALGPLLRAGAVTHYDARELQDGSPLSPGR